MDETTVDRELELEPTPGWEVRGDRIVKRFTFDDFRAATMFVGRVADATVVIDDEVEIEIRANQVTLTVLTPAAGTIAETGLALAGRIDRLTGDHRHPVGMADP